jgi:hypothetical protein
MLDLLYFFRKKQNDPVSDVYSAKRWISTLPLQDEYQAHRMIVNALNMFNANTEPLTRERLKVLKRLDDSSQALQESLSRQYLKNRGNNDNLDQTLWKEVFALYWHLAHGYQAFVRASLKGREAEAISSYRPLVTARALHNFSMEIRWRYFQQERAQPNMWKRLNKFFRVAESNGYLAGTVKMDGGSKTSTCQREYAKIVLLDMLNPTSLHPRQIVQVANWLENWSEKVSFVARADFDHHTHYVDLSEAAGAIRLKNVVSGDKIRFFSVNEVLKEVSRLRDGLSKGELPERLGLGMNCRTPECIGLLDQIANLWLRETPARVYPRKAGEKISEVVCGIDAIVASMETPGAAETKGAEPIIPEEWTSENTSDNGCGIKIDAGVCKDAAIGKLVALRPENATGRMVIGAIRWMSSIEPGRLAMGIEKFSEAPRLVELHHLDGDKEQGKRLEVTKALFLPKVDDVGIASSLILPSSEAVSGRLLDLYDKNIIYKVRLVATLEKSGEWARARFDILGRRSRKL